MLEHVAGQPLQVKGKIGSVPEIYIQSDYDGGWSLMTAFSGGPARHTETIKVNPDKVLGVLNHAYSVEKDGINVNMEFPCADESREVFVLGNEGCGVRILSSTGWLDRIDVSGKTLNIRAGSDTEILLDIQGKKKESHRIPAGKTLKISL